MFTGKTGPVYPLHSSRIQTGCSSATLKTLQQHRSAIRQGKTSAESLVPCHCEIRLMPLPPNPTVFWSAILSWVGLNRWRWTNSEPKLKLRRLLTGSGFLCPTPNLPNPTWLKDSPRTGTMFICPINASKAFNTENQRHWKPQPPPVSRPERWCLWRESAARSDNTTVPMAHPEKGRAYGASKRTTQKSKLMERNIPNFGSILKVTVDKDVGSQVCRL